MMPHFFWQSDVALENIFRWCHLTNWLLFFNSRWETKSMRIFPWKDFSWSCKNKNIFSLIPYFVLHCIANLQDTYNHGQILCASLHLIYKTFCIHKFCSTWIVWFYHEQIVHIWVSNLNFVAVSNLQVLQFNGLIT